MHKVAGGTTGKGLTGLLYQISRALAYVAGAFTLLLMMTIVIDVFMRRVLSRPIPGALEISEGILPVAVFLAFAYTEATGGNVRVTMLSERFAPKVRLCLDVLVYAIGTIALALLTWKTFESAAASLDIREEAAGVLPFPIYPTKFAITLGCFMITILFVSVLVSKTAHLITSKREG